MVENNINELPWYLEEYAISAKKKQFQDKEGEEFNRDFMPLYLKYAGTKHLIKHIRNYINTHEIKRRDDLRFTLVMMWCWHIQYYRERRGIKYVPEDVFKIRIPKEITNLHD